MQAIKAGDVYFLKAPVKMANPQKEKRLAYLLTTVSARPAVVIRPPMWWDDFGTVTVLPALTDAKNAITFHMTDRYGMISESTYPITPHTPHSVPVSRLGRYIGSLDEKELKSLIYAYQWIHDPEMQKTHPIPECYKSVIGPNVKIPNARTRTPRTTPFIYIDDRNVIHISDSTGVKYNIAEPIDTIPAEVNKEDAYVYMDAESPETEVAVTTAESNVVVGTGRFPASIFDESDLLEVANRFDIDPKFYEGIIKKRDIKCLNKDELATITSNLSAVKVQAVVDLYNSMQPVDALLFGPHLPLRALCRICRLSVNEASALKRLCCVLRDLTDDDYTQRMSPKPASVKAEEPAVSEGKLQLARDQKEIQEIIGRLRPYLNPKGLSKLPESLYEDFLRCPAHVVRRAFSGKGFQSHYTTEYTRIKKHIGKEIG